MKNRPVPACFTLCLPGSPKVNAGGAYGAWVPGHVYAGFRFHHRTPFSAATRNVLAGPWFDELVQWMVQDASLSSRGLKLT